MDTNQPESVEKQFNSFLANCEEARTTGTPSHGGEEADLPPELQQELERDLAFADLLHQVFQSPGADTGPPPEESQEDRGGPSSPGGAEPSAGLPWTCLGRFQIRRELGRGSFGIVYLAYDPRLDLDVALKVPHASALADPQLRERFQREARAAAGLEHPQVVRVYEAREVGPVCYIASAYCPGLTLAQWLKQRNQPVPVQQAAALVAMLADGVYHAHTRGVVHRDLKPANILLASGGCQPPGEGCQPPGANEPGEVHPPLAEFSPRIADFGLAKVPLKEGEASPTQNRAIVGTFEYMAPEQAAGKSKEVGPAADTYALGVILYELLTGRPPFRGETWQDTLEQVRCQEPTAPGRLRRKLSRDLETICLKCLEKEPKKRYASAQALADDLRRFLAGEPVQARPTPAWVRGLKWAKRRPALAALLVVSAVALLALGGVGGVWAWWQERTERLQAERRADSERAKLAVEAALAQAERLQRQALWVEAEEALDKVAALAEAAGLRQDLEQARANLKLVKKLDDIRFRGATRVEGHFRQYDHAGAAVAYAAAFQEHGLDIGAHNNEVALAKRIASSPVKDHLVAALDAWVLFAWFAGKTKECERLLAIARRADPDRWRDQFRDLKTWGKRGQLECLAARPEIERWSPALLKALGVMLRRLGGDGVGLLQRAQQRYPEDFWLNFDLANALQDPTQRDQKVGYIRAALAVRPRSAPAYYNLGHALYARRDLAGAIAAYNKAIALDPKDAGAHNNLGLALKAKGDAKGAIAAYKKAIDVYPKDAGAYFNLGNVRKAGGDLDGALTAYKMAIKFAPRFAWAHMNRGVALKAKGDLHGAIAAYKKAITIDPKDANAHANLGEALRDKKDLDGAIDEYEKAIALDPTNAFTHNNFGNILKEKGQFDKAIAEYNKAIALDPKYAPAHSNLGNSLADKGDLAGAIASHNKAIALDPKYAPAQAHYNLGKALHAKRDLEGAIAAYQKAIAIDPKLVQAHLELGVALVDKRRLDEAIAAFEQAIKLDHNYAPAHSNLGNALYAKGDLAGAIASHRKAIALAPKLAQAHYNLGNALYAKRDLDEAIAAFKKAIKLDRKSAQFRYNLGNALADKGDLDGAITAFEQAITIDPKNAKAQFNLGTVLEEKKDLDGAIAAYKRAIVIDPNMAQGHTNLGQVLADKGDLDGAIAAFKQAIAIAPKLPNGYVGLGQALLMKGRFADAQGSYRKAIKLLSENASLREQVSQELQLCRRLIKLDGRLSAIDAGKAKAANAAEELALADLCKRYKKRYAAAVRFYAGAFAKLAGEVQWQPRYNAARAAALAGAGRGKDADKLATEERARCRKQARDWLRASLDLWKKQLDRNNPPLRAFLRKVLPYWQRDPGLAGVRDEEELVWLVAEERRACRQLWADVEALLEKTQKPK
jgi:tetratricopeptide (TPR) repeat protein